MSTLKIIGVAGASVDITDRKRAEEEKSKALSLANAAREASELKVSFAFPFLPSTEKRFLF